MSFHPESSKPDDSEQPSWLPDGYHPDQTSQPDALKIQALSNEFRSSLSETSQIISHSLETSVSINQVMEAIAIDIKNHRSAIERVLKSEKTKLVSLPKIENYYSVVWQLIVRISKIFVQVNSKPLLNRLKLMLIAGYESRIDYATDTNNQRSLSKIRQQIKASTNLTDQEKQRLVIKCK